MLERIIVCGVWKAESARESGQWGTAHGAPPRVGVGKYLKNLSDPDMDDTVGAGVGHLITSEGYEEDGYGYQQGQFRGPGIEHEPSWPS